MHMVLVLFKGITTETEENWRRKSLLDHSVIWNLM